MVQVGAPEEGAATRQDCEDELDLSGGLKQTSGHSGE